MSAIARYYLHIGAEVLGYDRSLGSVALQLQKEGIWITSDADELWKEGRLRSAAKVRVIYTAAIAENSTILQAFREKGYTVRKRAMELASIVDGRNCMAVAGTHGKTTTASILTHILKESGQAVTAFLGGISEDFGSNFLHVEAEDETRRVFVVEADEYDRSFLQLNPVSACITSLDADHLDIYDTPEKLKEAYMQFLSQVQNPNAVFAPVHLGLKARSLALDGQGEFAFRDIRVSHGVYEFDFVHPDGIVKGVKTGLPGRHNLMNALGALALALQCVPAETAARSLQTCKGVWRRFNVLYRSTERVIVDDYAHHPTEIDAVYQALKELYPGRDLHALFQPHLYSRTRDFGQGFARSLQRFDSVRLMEVYPAREEPIPGVDSRWLLQLIDHPDKGILSKSELSNWYMGMAPGVLASMGAGDIGEEIRRVVNEIKTVR